MIKSKLAKSGLIISLFWGIFLIQSHIAYAVEWAKAYGSPDYTWATSIQQTSDGGYIVGGNTLSSTIPAWVLKLDGDGNVVWRKTYGGGYYPTYHTRATSIQQTSDGGYIVAGEIRRDSAASLVWVLKLDGDGDVQWQKTYGGTSPDFAFSIQQMTDGGYIVAGSTMSFGAGNGDAWVLKLDGDGDVQWQKTYGGAHSEVIWSIQQTSDG